MSKSLKRPLPPITIRLRADELTISRERLAHEITRQIGSGPTTGGVADQEAHPCTRYPFCAGEHFHPAWTEVGDFRDELMEGIKPISTLAEIEAIAAKRRTLVELNMRPRTKAEADTVRHAFEIMKAEFMQERGAREIQRARAIQVVSDRIKALLDNDVAAGNLRLHSKNEEYYVKVDDLVRWAEYRRVIVEQEQRPPMLILTSNRSSQGSHGSPDGYSSALPPWMVKDPRDHEPDDFQPWYTPARYFARQEVRADPALLKDRPLLAQHVAKRLSEAQIYRRGKTKRALDPSTVLKAFVRVHLG